MDNTGGMSFSELLSLRGVTEEFELRGSFGFLAFHGGPVERVTSLIAAEAATRGDASFYAVDQPEELSLHIPSTRVQPAESPTLAKVLAHVDTVCAVHGYGLKANHRQVLIGGRNRELAEHIGSHLRQQLGPTFPVVTDLDRIPKRLRGVHARNPANLTSGGGVQLELPPELRWNTAARDWADAPGLEMTAEVEATVHALAEAARAWVA